MTQSKSQPGEATVIDRQMVEVCLLYMGVLFYQVFVLAACIALATTTFRPAPAGAVCVSGLDSGSPFRVGGYLCALVEDEEGNVSYAGADSSGTPNVVWPAEEMMHYTFVFRGPPEELKLRVWLRDVDPARLEEGSYVRGLQEGICVVVYPAAEAAEVQEAIAAGNVTSSLGIVCRLHAGNGFCAEVVLENRFFYGESQ